MKMPGPRGAGTGGNGKDEVNMELALVIGLFLLGIVLIVKGGDAFVDAASWIAEVSGIPKLIVGATIVSIATTIPEMLVSVMAAADGKVDMSVGNAVGSVTANLGLIMAISLICMPGVIRRADYLLKSVLMLAAAGVIVLAGAQGAVTAPLSVVLIVIFAVFVVENVRSARRATALETASGAAPERPAVNGRIIGVNAAKFILGAAGIVIGAQLLVDNGSELARMVGVSERIIGVTLVAVGTSLPELVTTITAVIKKQSDLSVGNIIGANIIDLTLILPVSAAVSGKALPINAASGWLDLPACLLVGAIAVIPAMISSKFHRWQGIVLLLVYIAYVALTCSYGSI